MGDVDQDRNAAELQMLPDPMLLELLKWPQARRDEIRTRPKTEVKLSKLNRCCSRPFLSTCCIRTRAKRKTRMRRYVGLEAQVLTLA